MIICAFSFYCPKKFLLSTSTEKEYYGIFETVVAYIAFVTHLYPVGDGVTMYMYLLVIV